MLGGQDVEQYEQALPAEWDILFHALDMTSESRHLCFCYLKSNKISKKREHVKSEIRMLFITNLHLTAKNNKNSSMHLGARARQSWIIFWDTFWYIQHIQCSIDVHVFMLYNWHRYSLLKLFFRPWTLCLVPRYEVPPKLSVQIQVVTFNIWQNAVPPPALTLSILTPNKVMPQNLPVRRIYRWRNTEESLTHTTNIEERKQYLLGVRDLLVDSHEHTVCHDNEHHE